MLSFATSINSMARKISSFDDKKISLMRDQRSEQRERIEVILKRWFIIHNYLWIIIYYFVLFIYWSNVYMYVYTYNVLMCRIKIHFEEWCFPLAIILQNHIHRYYIRRYSVLKILWFQKLYLFYIIALNSSMNAHACICMCMIYN